MTKVGGEENVDRRNEAEAVNSDDESVADESDDEQEAVHMKWLQQSFVKPLRALQELSSFPNLLCLMKILVTVAVTSCSAERVMSRVKIVKNRLRSTMNDEWFSALTILASERDITDSLPTNQIIDTFALCSTKLQNILGVHADSEKT
jgi:hAT family C-terminal dimerisation region